LWLVVVVVFWGLKGLSSNGLIVFDSDRAGNREIYVMQADGSGQTRLTFNSAVDWYPAWSPDGSKIAFTSDRDGNWEIYVMNINGKEQRNLTQNPGNDWAPDWSPDGKKIVFVSDRDGNEEIYVMNADGTNQVRLTYNNADDRDPVWSPDGTKIAFYSNRDGNWEIYVMNADGSNQTRLTYNPARDGHPAWSPDGTKIAFDSDRDGNSEIYIMNADGTNQTRLTFTPGNEGGVAWSPDGTKLVFHAFHDDNWEICMINADGTMYSNLTQYPMGNDFWPDWRPYGMGVCGGPLADTPWPMFQRGNKHQGLSPYIGPSRPRKKWEYPTDWSAGQFYASPVFGIDGFLYIPDFEGVIYRVDPETGAGEPFFDLGQRVASSLAVAADGTLYAAIWDTGLIYAINPDGTLRWVSEPLEGDIFHGSPAIGSDGTIYIGSGFTFYALNCQNGKIKWSVRIGDHVQSSSPAIAVIDGEERIFFGAATGKVYCYTPSGQLIWEFPTTGGVTNPVTIADDGTIYVQSCDRMYAINPDGTLKWENPCGNGSKRGVSPAIGPDGTIYVLAGDSEPHDLYAIDPLDGHIKWSSHQTVEYNVYSSPTVDANGTIYISDDYYTYAINPSDGSLKWRIEGGALYSGPIIGPGGVIYVGSSYMQRLYAFEETKEISRTITVVSPNGGEKWPAGSTQEIKWESQNAGYYVKIEYSTDGGTTWKSIVDSTENDGSYHWTVPNEPSDTCRVKITSVSYPSVYDLSDGDFTIVKAADTTPPALVTDFSASDGENEQSTLTWTNPADPDLAEVIVRRKTNEYPINHTDGILVYQDTSPVPGQVQSYTDTGLTNGTTYYYAIFSRDTAGNWNDTVEPGENADVAWPGCTDLPSSLLSAAARNEALHKLVLDTAAIQVSKRTFDFVANIITNKLLEAVRQFVKSPGLGELPQEIEWFEDFKMGTSIYDISNAIQEIRIVSEDDLLKLWTQKGFVIALKEFAGELPVLVAQSSQDAIKDIFEHFCGMPNMKEIMEKARSVFSSLRNCAGPTGALTSENILKGGQEGISKSFNEEIESVVTLYDEIERLKIGVTCLQISILAGTGTLILVTGGAGAPAALSAAVAGEGMCEAIKLGLTVGQAITLAALWAVSPYFTNTITTIGIITYERAGLTLMGLEEEQLPSLKIVEISSPDLILPGEVKSLKVKVKNTSKTLAARAKLSGKVVYYTYLPAFAIPISVSIPIESPLLEIAPGDVVSVQVPISYPLFLLLLGGFPIGGTISTRINYGWLVPYGASIDVPEQDFGLIRVVANIVKDAKAFVQLKPTAKTLQQSTDQLVTFQVTLTITNCTDAFLEDVMIFDSIPEKLTPINVQFEVQPQFIHSNKFIWNLSLRPHEVKILRYSFTTKAVNPGDVYYLPPAVAEVPILSIKQINEEGTTQTLKSSSVIAMVHNAALSIKGCTIIPDLPVVNQPFRLTVEVENIGRDPITNAQVAATLPDGLICLDDLVKSIDLILPGGTAAVSWVVQPTKTGNFVIEIRAQALFSGGDVQITTLKVLPARVTPQFIKVGPNPVPPEGCIFWLNFPDDVVEATLKIFDVDGALVVSIPLDPAADRYPETGRWVPQDAQGRLLGTGLYLYCVEIKHADGTITYSPVQKMVIRR
jgi:uncharacterized repeat protein (TIGR01451 family)